MELINKNQVPEGYKKTEVGVIPEDWEVKKIEKLGSNTIPAIKAGPFGSHLTKNTYVSNGYKIYGQEQVIRGDYLYGDYFISAQKFKELESCAVRPGDILLSLVGTMGKLLVIPENAPLGIINPRLIRLSFNNDIVNPQFFKELFESGKLQSFLARYAQGGTMGVLNAGILRTISIGLPSITEQRAIASTLSDVDVLIAALDKLIAKKRHIKTATMQQLLTGKTRLPGFGEGKGYKKTEVGVIPEDWEVGSIESVVPPGKKYGIVDGPFGSNLKSIHYKTFGIPIISSGYVTEGHFFAKDYIYVDSQKFYQEKRSAVSGGDIVMAKIGARCGASAILPKDHETGILSGNALKITVNSEKHSTYFIWQLLSNLYVKGQLENITTVGAQPAVSMANLKKYKIPLPPLPEQKAIAQILSDIDSEIAALEKRRAKTQAIKQGMMQELLTGRTRLKFEHPDDPITKNSNG